MNDWSQNELIIILLTFTRFVLGIVFLFSATGKIRNPDYFVRVVSNYQILPKPLVKPFALCLPWVEVLTGVLLLFGYQTRIAAVISGGLFLVFFLALEINLVRGHTNMDCGCFGAGHRDRINNKLLLRDLFMMALSIFVAIGGSGPLTIESQWPYFALLVNGHVGRDTLLPIFLIVVGMSLLLKLIVQFLRLLYPAQIEDKL